MKIFGDLTNQRFGTSFRDPTAPFLVLTQDNQLPLEFYPVRPTGAARFPFHYDRALLASALESPVLALCNPGSSPLTLTSPALLTPIRNGFSGILDLATAEIAQFLGPRAEREAVLSFDAIIDNLPRTLFQGRLLVRPDATAATATASYQLSGASEPLALTAAGATDLAPDASFLQWFQLVEVTPAGAPYTHQLTLDSARAGKGATFTVQVLIPASAFPPTIEIYSNAVSGSPLETITGDTDNEVHYRFEAVLNDSGAWEKSDGAFL